MNATLREDISSFTLPEGIVNELRGATVLITGATGLIGSSIVRCLSALDAGIKFVLPLRNAKKFEENISVGNLNALIVESDLVSFFEQTQLACDYIFHCASPTDGSYMQSHPVETYLFAVESTKAMLDYCRRTTVKSAVYLSSIERYGQIFTNDPVDETAAGYIDTQSARSSYPLGKLSAEYLCTAYAREYGVPVRTARLTQTFGAGIDAADKRVFAQFARSVINHTDIVMHTSGESAKPYVYTTDCVSALMYILTLGSAGEAYNVATPGTYISIRELACLYQRNFAPEINVVVDTSKNQGYAPATTVNLNPAKLLALGWTPQHDLTSMVGRLISYLKEIENGR